MLRSPKETATSSKSLRFVHMRKTAEPVPFEHSLFGSLKVGTPVQRRLPSWRAQPLCTSHVGDRWASTYDGEKYAWWLVMTPSGPLKASRNSSGRS